MKSMWEILVPTERRVPHVSKEGAVKKFYTTRFHRVWDEKVRAISGGLTILTPAKGQWISPDGVLFSERMIPVRIICTQDEIVTIIDMTMDYYDQLAVLCYRVSDLVIMRTREDRRPRVHPCNRMCMRVATWGDTAAGDCGGGCLFDKEIK